MNDGRIFGDLHTDGYYDKDLKERMALMENNRPIYSDIKNYQK